MGTFHQGEIALTGSGPGWQEGKKEGLFNQLVRELALEDAADAEIS